MWNTGLQPELYMTPAVWCLAGLAASMQTLLTGSCVQMVFIDNITPYLGLEALRSSTQGKTKYRRRLTALRTLVVCIFHVDAVRIRLVA